MEPSCCVSRMVLAVVALIMHTLAERFQRALMAEAPGRLSVMWLMQLLRKFVALLMEEAAALVLGVATFAVLARALRVEDFGTVSFAMSTALMLGVLIDMGQNSHLSRLTAQDPRNAGAPLSRVVANKAVIGLMVMCVASAGLTIAGFSA